MSPGPAADAKGGRSQLISSGSCSIVLGGKMTLTVSVWGIPRLESGS